jgi:histidyl-tRNA synthetase
VRRAPGKGLRDADRAGARFAALRGERERADDSWTLKHLASGEQRTVLTPDLARAVRKD